MNHRLKWSLAATLELDRIICRIALEQPIAAEKIAKRVKEATELLKNFPTIGSEVGEPGLFNGCLRQLIIHPCRLFYLVTSGQVVIISIERTEKLPKFTLMISDNFNFNYLFNEKPPLIHQVAN